MRGLGPGFPSWGGFCAAALGLCLACRSGSPPGSPASGPRPQPLRVLSSYRAPLGCPTQQEYLEFVAKRAATLRLTPESALPGAVPEEAPPESDRVRVRIQPDTSSAGWVGVLRIEGADALEREVHG